MSEDLEPSRDKVVPQTNPTTGSTISIDPALIEEAIHADDTHALPADPTRRLIQTDAGDMVMEVERFMLRIQEIRESLLVFLKQRGNLNRSDLLGYIAIFTPTIELSLKAIRLVSQREYVFLSFINEAIRPNESATFDEQAEGMYRLGEYVKHRMYDLLSDGKISIEQFNEDFELISLIVTLYSKAIPELK